MLIDTMESRKQKAVFLDRDGTLVEEVNFLSRVEDLRIFPFSKIALTRLKEAGFSLIVVTNQSGIGRGIYTEEAMHEIHRVMQADLSSIIDEFHFCPHLPDEGCFCRKPSTGMIESALAGRAIDLENSWMIGDKRLDVETGKNAGLKTALVKTGYGLSSLDDPSVEPDIVADDLLDAVEQILDEPGHRAI